MHYTRISYNPETSQFFISAATNANVQYEHVLQIIEYQPLLLFKENKSTPVPLSNKTQLLKIFDHVYAYNFETTNLLECEYFLYFRCRS